MENDEELRVEEWVDPDKRERVWLVCQTGVLPARVVEEEVKPNEQLQISLKELSSEARAGNESRDIKHKGDRKHSDGVHYKLMPIEKSKQCDDISFTSLSKPKVDKKEERQSYLSEPTEDSSGKGLLRVQLEESHEILEVDRRFIEKVSACLVAYNKCHYQGRSFSPWTIAGWTQE